MAAKEKDVLDPIFCTYIVNYCVRNMKRHAERWERLEYYIRADECQEQVAYLMDVKDHALNDLLKAGVIWQVRDRPHFIRAQHIPLAGHSTVRREAIGFHLPRRKLWVPLPDAVPHVARGCRMNQTVWPQGYSLDAAVKLLTSLS